MKQISQYEVGDEVQLCEYDDMQELLSCYETNQDPVELLSVAGCKAKITWLPSQAEMDNWDGLIAVQIIEDGSEDQASLLVPAACIGDIVQLPMAFLGQNDEPVVIRDVNSEHEMITQLAVETIQNAYRRYEDCKSAVKLKKLSSSERLVHELASDTIKTKWKKKRQNKIPLHNTPLKADTSKTIEVLLDDPIIADESAVCPAVLCIDSIVLTDIPPIRWDGKNNDLYVKASVQYTIMSPVDGAASTFPDACSLEFLTNTAWSAGETATWTELKWRFPKILKLDSDTKEIATYSHEIDAAEYRLDRLTVHVFQANLVRKHQLIGELVITSNQLAERYSAAHIMMHGNEISGCIIHYKEHLKVPHDVKNKGAGIELKIPNWNDVTELSQAVVDSLQAQLRLPKLTSAAVDGNRSPVKIMSPDRARGIALGENPKVVKPIPPLFPTINGVALNVHATSVISGRKSPETTDAEIARAEEELRKFEMKKKPIGGSGGRKSELSSSSSSRKVLKDIDVVKETLRATNMSPTRNSPPAKKLSTSTAKIEPIQGSSKQGESRPLSSSRVSNSNLSTTNLKQVPPAAETIQPAMKRKKRKKSKTLDLNNSLRPADGAVAAAAGSKEYTIVDKAFEISLQHCSADVQLTHAEVDRLLIELGIQKVEPLTNEDAKWNDALITLPLHKLPLSATLSKYIMQRNTRLHSESVPGFILSPKQTAQVINRLSKVISGPWSEVRKIVCQLCNSSNVVVGDSTSSSVVSTTQQPDSWNRQSIMKFLNATALPMEWFDACINGKQLLDCEADANASLNMLSENEDAMEDSLALLKLRWKTYRKTLCLLNEWWARGIRPEDAVTNTEESIDMRPMTNKDVQPLGMLRSSPMVPYLDMEEGAAVKVSKNDHLLQHLIPLNRAYGFGINMTLLSAIASFCGGVIGNFADARVLFELNTGSSATGKGGIKAGSYKRSHWIVFDHPEIKRGLTDLFVSNDISDQQPSIYKILSDSEVAILIPEICLLVPQLNDASLLMRQHSNGFRRYDVIAIGTMVCIAPLNVLKRSYERFDWWDKPDDATLESICNKRGEVIAVTELQSKGRIGLMIAEVDIIDAIPIEALSKEVQESQRNQSRNSLLRYDSESPIQFTDSETESEMKSMPITSKGNKAMEANQSYAKPIPLKSSAGNLSGNMVGIADSGGFTPKQDEMANRSAQVWLNRETSSMDDVLDEDNADDQSVFEYILTPDMKVKASQLSQPKEMNANTSDGEIDTKPFISSSYHWLKKSSVDRPKSATTGRPVSAGGNITSGQGNRTLAVHVPTFDEENASFVDGSSFGRDKAAKKHRRKGEKSNSPSRKHVSKKKQELQSIIAARTSRMEAIVLQSREYNLNHQLIHPDSGDEFIPAKPSYKEQHLELTEEEDLIRYNKYLNSLKAHEDKIRGQTRSDSPDSKLVVESDALQKQNKMNWVNILVPETIQPPKPSRPRPKSASATRAGIKSLMEMGRDLSPTSKRIILQNFQAEAVEEVPLKSQSRPGTATVTRAIRIPTDSQGPPVTVEDLIAHTTNLKFNNLEFPSPVPPVMKYSTPESRLASKTSKYTTAAKNEDYIQLPDSARGGAAAGTGAGVESKAKKVDPGLQKMLKRSENDANNRREKLLLRDLRKMNPA